MRQAGKRVLVGLVLAAVLAMGGVARAGEFDMKRMNQEVGLEAGFGVSMRHKVNIYSLLPHWGIFIISPGGCAGRLGVEFKIEGIVSAVDAKGSGFELGFTPLFKVSYLLTPGFMIFLEGGAGIITESFDSPAVAHAFNFTPQVGAGFEVALSRQLALTASYRFRHSSNAGIYAENPAFNCSFAHAGLNWYY